MIVQDEEQTTEPQAEVAEEVAEPQAEATEDETVEEGKEWADLSVEAKLDALAQGLAHVAAQPSAAAPKIVTFPPTMQIAVQPVPVQNGGGAVVTLIDPDRNEHYRFRLMPPAAERVAGELAVSKIEVFGPDALAAARNQRGRDQAAQGRGRRRR